MSNTAQEATAPKRTVADIKAELAALTEVELGGKIEALVAQIRELSTTYDTSAVQIADKIREAVRVRRTVSAQ